MIDEVAQTTPYHALIDALRGWNIGEKACVFGTAVPEAICSQFSFNELVSITQQTYDLCNLYNLDTCWDVIFVHGILEQVPYPWIAVEEVRKHLNPNGVAVLITQFTDRISDRPSDYWRFTPDGLRLLCAGYAATIAGGARGNADGEGATPITWAIARVPEAPQERALWQPPLEEHAAEGGPWQVDDFVETGGDQWVEKRVCDYLVSTFAPATALDIGCGAGLFVSYLNHRDVDTWGVEAANLRSIFPLPEKFIQHDLRLPLDLNQQFDLVLCLEVAEHIDSAFEQVLFETLRRHSKRYLLFSAAIVGQEGHGHINLHPEAYWFARLRERGYRLLVDPTNICRALCVHPWYAKNISFWELAPDQPNEEPDAVLSRLIDLPDSYVRRIEDDYVQQRVYIDTLQEKHIALTSSWEVQRQHIVTVEEQHRHLLETWEHQQHHAAALEEQYQQLLEAWERQQQHATAAQEQYQQLLEAWERQQQHIADLEQHISEAQDYFRRQHEHITDLEQRHAELLALWEGQRRYIDDLEQQCAKLTEEWNTQHQYIEDVSQRHTQLTEEWHKQRDYINQILYKR